MQTESEILKGTNFLKREDVGTGENIEQTKGTHFLESLEVRTHPDNRS